MAAVRPLPATPVRFAPDAVPPGPAGRIDTAAYADLGRERELGSAIGAVVRLFVRRQRLLTAGRTGEALLCLADLRDAIEELGELAR